MPNYSKLEEQLLGPAERELARQSRQPALGALNEAGIYRLIAQLDAAQSAADAAPKGDGRSPADLLGAALRRVHAERRKRGLKPQPGKPAGARAAAAQPAAKPAPAAKRVPASPARKPAGRAKAETRKNDLRTGSRLVTKRRAKTETAVEAAAALVVADATPSTPAAPSRKKVAKDAARKAAAKAAKAAEKESRKIARKAAKDAEKAAKKAAKKAVKDADKAAKKAARKAKKAAAKSGSADA